MNADSFPRGMRPRFDVQSTRLATGGRVARQERRSFSPRAIYRRLLDDLKRLHAMLAELESLCDQGRIDPDRPEAPFMALHRFKALSPLFEEVEFFIAVTATHADGLEARKRRNAEAQLDLLRRRLARLHLESVAPLLRLLEEKHAPLPIGTRYVLGRWLSELDRMQQDLTLPCSETDPDSPVLDSLLAEVRRLSLSLHDRAPDLPDFSMVGDAPAALPSFSSPSRRLPLSTPSSAHPLAAHPRVHLVLQRREGRLFVDGPRSGPLMAEIHRLGLGDALAGVFGIRPAVLPMLLNGHDPLPADRLDSVVAFLREALGEQGFDLVSP
ncbi:hypothetical protein [Rhodocista pekingensis]|uniref:Hemerythrin-like domain-containing protein n=1 Tax=Rhodocista pekingensis TaxID=201185 RepID=A0ABW2L0I9_9PROT